MAGSGDDVELLLFGQIDELDRVSGNADGEVGVFRLLGVVHRIDELLGSEDVDVEMVRALIEVSVEDLGEVVLLLLLTVAKSIGSDGLGVGDAVEGIFVRELGDGVERSKQAVLLSPIGGVGARRERLTGFAAIGEGPSGFAVNDVGSDGEDRGGRLGIAIGVMLGDLAHEGFEHVDGDLIGPVVIIAITGEVTFDFEVGGDALLVADGFDFGVFDGGERIDDVGESGDAGGEGAADIGVDKSHLCGLIVILVVHVLDEVEGVDVDASEPVHHEIEFVEDLIIIEVFGGNGGVFGADLLEALLVFATVYGVKEALGEVGPGAEELHFLAGLSRGDAAADGIVIGPDRAHHIIVLVLNGRGRDGDLGGVFLEGLGQTGAPENGEVRLRGGTHVLEGVEEAVIGLGHHAPAVLSHTSDFEGGPDGVAREEGVIGRNTGEFDHAELHDEMVDELLGAFFGELARSEVAVDVDVEEGGDAANAHGGAVLGLDGGEIAEVKPLDGLFGVVGGLRDVEAIGGGHLFHALEGPDLLRELFAEADDVIGHRAIAAVGFVFFFPSNELVNAIKGNAAIVTDDPAAAIGIGKTGEDLVVTAFHHLRGVSVEDAVVVGFLIKMEGFVDFRINGVAIGGASGLGHLDAAIRHESPLQRLIGLKADDFLEVLVQIARTISGERRDDGGFHIEDTALGPFFLLKLLQFVPKFRGGLTRAG